MEIDGVRSYLRFEFVMCTHSDAGDDAAKRRWKIMIYCSQSRRISHTNAIERNEKWKKKRMKCKHKRTWELEPSTLRAREIRRSSRAQWRVVASKRIEHDNRVTSQHRSRCTSTEFVILGTASRLSAREERKKKQVQMKMRNTKIVKKFAFNGCWAAVRSCHTSSSVRLACVCARDVVKSGWSKDEAKNEKKKWNKQTVVYVVSAREKQKANKQKITCNNFHCRLVWARAIFCTVKSTWAPHTWAVRRIDFETGISHTRALSIPISTGWCNSNRDLAFASILKNESSDENWLLATGKPANTKTRPHEIIRFCFLCRTQRRPKESALGRWVRRERAHTPN